MAEQQLIKGTFHGSAGTLTGAKWKNKETVKQRIWSRTPNSPLQEKNVRAFECLNRMASAMSAQWWYRLGLKDRGMHKHNAVASFLKPAIKSHLFEPANLDEVFAEDGTAEITAYAYDGTSGLLSVGAKTSLPLGPRSPNSWLVMVLDDTGHVYLCQSPTTQSVSYSFYIPSLGEKTPIVCTFTTQLINKRVKYGGFSIKGAQVATTVVFNLVSPQIAIDGSNYSFTIATAPALPEGAYSLALQTHALSQGSYADEEIGATLTMESDGNGAVVFAPHVDTLAQKDVFLTDSYVKIKAGSATFDTGAFKWQDTQLSVKTEGEFSLDSVATILSASTDGESLSVNFDIDPFPLATDAEFELPIYTLDPINLVDQIGYAGELQKSNEGRTYTKAFAQELQAKVAQTVSTGSVQGPAIEEEGIGSVLWQVQVSSPFTVPAHGGEITVNPALYTVANRWQRVSGAILMVFGTKAFDTTKWSCSDYGWGSNNPSVVYDTQGGVIQRLTSANYGYETGSSGTVRWEPLYFNCSSNLTQAQFDNAYRVVVTFNATMTREYTIRQRSPSQEFGKINLLSPAGQTLEYIRP